MIRAISICLLPLAVSLALGQAEKNIGGMMDVDPSISSVSISQTDGVDTIGVPFPTYFNFNYAGEPNGVASGTVGAFYMNGMYYFNRWNSTWIYRYDNTGPNGGPGSFVDSLPYTGNLRDLTTDGQYIYGGKAGNILFKLDADANLISQYSITGTPAVVIRTCAYDPNRNGFWVSNFTDNIRLIDTTGAVLATIPATTIGGKYGMAWDSSSTADSAFLWVWGQGVGNGKNVLTKIHVASGTVMSVDSVTLVPSGGSGFFGIAGGAGMFTNIGTSALNHPVLLLNYQNFALGGYSLRAPGPTIVTRRPNKPIPDNDPIGIRDTITLPAGNIGQIQVRIDTVLHTWDADLDFFLHSPSGDSIELMTGVGGSGDDFINTLLTDTAAASIASGVAPFNGNYRPEASVGPITAFALWNGTNAAGDWVLHITDNAGADLGTLIQWSIIVDYGAPLVPVISVSPDSIIHTLGIGDSVDVPITIANTGGSLLNWSASVIGASMGEGVSVSYFGDEKVRDGKILATGSPVSLEEYSARTGLPVKMEIAPEDIPDMAVEFHKQPSHVGPYINRLPEEVFGSNANAFGPAPRNRGNFFTCTKSTTLIEHRSYLNAPSGGTTMWFLVYEGNAQVGIYNLISAADVSPQGPGEGWYSSGSINIPMSSGKYYMITSSYEQPCTYYNQQNITPYPIVASFGQLTAGAGWNYAPTNNFPPDATQNVPSTTFGAPVAYYQTVVTSTGPPSAPWIRLLDPTSGSIGAGGNTDLMVRLYGVVQRDTTRTATVRITSNDPISPTKTVPVRLTILTDVEETGSGLPEKFLLSQNFPNPFNPSTTIKYGLPSQSFVTLKVYDLLGREVVSLVNDIQSGGTFTIDWNGRNATGERVASGLYFYRLEARTLDGNASAIDMKKMVLLK